MLNAQHLVGSTIDSKTTQRLTYAPLRLIRITLHLAHRPNWLWKALERCLRKGRAPSGSAANP